MRLHPALVAGIVIGLAACGGDPVPDQPSESPEVVEKLVIYTVNYPLAYFTERIGGDLVEVHFPAPADEDPAYWSPDAETIAAYQSADLILLNGADYAKWVDRATLPASKMVDTSAAFADRLIPLEGATTHSHGPEGEHEHTGWAATTWLDPALALEQAEAVASSISSSRPEKSLETQARLEELRSDLQTLDARLGAAAAAIGSEPLFFSHPVYQYVISRYKLNAVQAHWDPEVAPDGHDWGHFKKRLGNHPAKWMLWEGVPLEEVVTDLDELGVGSLLFDPCGNTPEEGDYLSVMDANAGALETVAETLVQ